MAKNVTTATILETVITATIGVCRDCNACQALMHWCWSSCASPLTRSKMSPTLPLTMPVPSTDPRTSPCVTPLIWKLPLILGETNTISAPNDGSWVVRQAFISKLKHPEVEQCKWHSVSHGCWQGTMIQWLLTSRRTRHQGSQLHPLMGLHSHRTFLIGHLYEFLPREGRLLWSQTSPQGPLTAYIVQPVVQCKQ